MGQRCNAHERVEQFRQAGSRQAAFCAVGELRPKFGVRHWITRGTAAGIVVQARGKADGRRLSQRLLPCPSLPCMSGCGRASNRCISCPHGRIERRVAFKIGQFHGSVHQCAGDAILHAEFRGQRGAWVRVVRCAAGGERVALP